MLKRVPTQDRRRLAIVSMLVVAVLLVAGSAFGAVRAEPTGLIMNGLPAGPVGAAALGSLELSVDIGDHDRRALRLSVDGREVSGEISGTTVRYRPAGLSEGDHTVTAEIRPGGLFGWMRTGRGVSRTFTVDTTAPDLEVAALPPVSSYRQPVTVRGKAIGAEHVTVGAGAATPDSSGDFEITLPRAPVGAAVTAVDAAGNTTTRPLSAAVALPRMKAVHVTAYGWADEGLRSGVLAMAREGRINTVELDIKDEDGMIGYASDVPLARESGASTRIYDARAALKTLHDMGIRVEGRIVAFRDPTLAGWAWRSGHPDWVVQDPAGLPYSSGYGAIAFTNFAHPEIRRYNIDLAAEAARLGFDGVMYDYVRRPDGPLDGMRFAGLAEPPTDSIAHFLRDSRDPVRDGGAALSAAVFGIAATRPGQIAQDIPMMAANVDYVAPMLYPSHWGAGEYGVADPNAQPYDIIARSLQDFRTQTAGTGAKVIPWLQDFSLGVNYGDGEVRAQIDAAAADGVDSFLLWNAASRYHAGALAPDH
ncbi:putative glycoside hydrolase [Nocardia wallacei]|uniref:putative glycoside hydrolase n=1 Tax=Nocardia wallacei TaxID=480035 RepID=UPI002453B4B0|nr:putative glycoside hydrolase [Nocardia wallacei]